MNERLTKMLFMQFPRLYRQPKEGDTTLMNWGFSHGDGWFEIVRDISQAIEDKARRMGIDPMSEDWPRAVQVKEKFGTLSFYLRAPETAEGEKSFHAAVAEIASRSQNTCERCGKPGKLRREGWFHTHCDKCEEEYLKAR